MPTAPKRHVAFLRGVNPMNCRMAELTRALELAGFVDVKTVLSSGNVLFRARGTETRLARQVEAAMQEHLGKTFFTQVRSVDSLQALLEADPFAAFRLPRAAKRVVTFLGESPAHKPKLPIETDGARILALRGNTAFSAYTPSPRGPVFMTLLERTFGKNITTRTWDTVRRVAK